MHTGRTAFLLPAAPALRGPWRGAALSARRSPAALHAPRLPTRTAHCSAAPSGSGGAAARGLSDGAAGDIAGAPAGGALGRRFRVRRGAVFLAMGVTYAWYVGLRSTFQFAAPGLGLPLPAIGAVASSFPAAYGLSRLVSGAVVDNGSPRVVLAVGLALAGAVVASMAAAPTAPGPFAALWLLHGLVQGAGAGASAKLLTAWFAPSERGRWWALWATSANAGAFAAPLLVAAVADRTCAHAALALPGVAAIAVALAAAPVLSDSPARAGFAVPWAPRARPAGGGGGGGGEGAGEAGAGGGFWRALWRTVSTNRALWALAGSYFLVYLVRNGLKNWLHFFLAATRGIAPAQAAVRASAMELGGVAGTFGAGVLSDLAGGRRVAVTLGYLVVLAAAVAALALFPAGSAAVDVALVAVVGCAVNGPQMMIGLIGAEVTDPRVMATASGLLGCISYAGATAAGYPLSALVAAHGWPVFFAALAAASVGAAALLSPFWRLRAGKVKEA